MSAKNGSIKLVAGNSNPALAQEIAAGLGLPLTKAVVRRFADMEIFVEIQENVRGSDAFIIQSTSFPANDHLMELLIITDALRRSSARRITAVIPYFGYARQDRKSGSRTPISAKLVANLITRAGVDRVMTLDLHAGQIQGFFDIPTDNLFASPVMVRDIKERFDLGKVMVVSPDVGGVVRARGLAKRINTSLAIIDKRRERAGESEVMNVIGDVAGHTCILIDDIVDSGGTLVNAAEALMANGAKDVYAYISHGVLSGGATARITVELGQNDAGDLHGFIETSRDLDRLLSRGCVHHEQDFLRLQEIFERYQFLNQRLIDLLPAGRVEDCLSRRSPGEGGSILPFQRGGGGALNIFLVRVRSENRNVDLFSKRGELIDGRGALQIARH